MSADADRPETAASSRRLRRVVSADGTSLAVHEAGDPDAPTVVLVHGFPDTHSVWDLVVARLENRYHVVAYDVRGAGASDPPTGPRGYGLDRLSQDLAAVIEAVAPGSAVHLVGHDWGSIQSWESVCDPDAAAPIASFTTISGPALDHVGHWIRDSLRRPTPRRLAPLLRQGLASTYIGLLQTRLAPPLMRLGSRRLWSWFLQRREGAEVDQRYPAATFAADVRNGLGLYRTDMLGRLRRPLERRTRVPVLVVVASRDPFVTPVIARQAGRWVDRLWTREIAASHWVVRSHADVVSRWIGELVDHVEGGDGPLATSDGQVPT